MAEFAGEVDGELKASERGLRRLLHRRLGYKPVAKCLPMPYLLKTEPSTYSFADLQKEGTTLWDGVNNPVALRNMREMKPGDELVVYHTGDEKQTVGTASVVSVDASDPKNPRVKIKAGKAVAKPVTLAEVKADARFTDSPLVRQGRLSVVPLTATQYKFLIGG
jgi:predicted RNA-binding protein with PUA-like domain